MVWFCGFHSLLPPTSDGGVMGVFLLHQELYREMQDIRVQVIKLLPVHMVS